MTETMPAVIGSFDGVFGGRLCGWAFRPTMPGERVRLLVKIDHAPDFEILADLFRPDLEEAGFGDGCHAFKVPAPRILADHGAHTITFLEISEGSPVLGSPHRLVFTDPAQLSTKRGVLDGVAGERVFGWACDTANLDQRETLQLLINGNVVQEFQTGLLRKDLRDAGLGDGGHGFSIPVPDLRSISEPCNLHVRFADGHQGLANSPVGYFNPGNILEAIGDLNKRLDFHEERLMYIEYLLEKIRKPVVAG